jgi:hypothetical protein
MTTFATSRTISGSPADALQAAVTMLTSNGFAITERNATSASLTGPGLYATRQNPILGATKIAICVDSQTLKLHAELGGVDRMRWFLTWFPLLLGLGLGLVFGAIGIAVGQRSGIGFGVPGAQGWRWMLIAIASGLVPLAPWLILSPLMIRMIRNRTHRALETLVANSCYATPPA